MRIAQVSTLSRPVPPPGEGSVEHLVGLLCDQLVGRGHDVTLYALAGSRTKARLRSPVTTSYLEDAGKWDWQLYEAFQARQAFADWRDFDVIHCHSYYHGLLFCDFAPIPSLHSLHIEPGPDYAFLAARARNRHLLCASRWQARVFGDLPGVHVIPHGIDVDAYHPAGLEREDYLAFLGRFIPDKGALEAIEIAARAGVRLKLAAPPNDYFERVIRPRVDGERVQYVGAVEGEAKREFLARARGLLYPVQRGEPFGLVLIEALAAGAPVLALARGAVPEIVVHGETGWLGEEPDDLLEGVRRLERFDSLAICAQARARFHYSLMLDRIEALLAETVEAAAP